MAGKKFNEKEHLHRHNHSDGPVVMKTSELLKILLLNKFSKVPKEPVADPDIDIMRSRRTPQTISVNHIAVVLDGKVEEVIRAENRLAALLLSDPEFIEFYAHDQVRVGDLYVDGKFSREAENDKKD